MAQLTRHHLHEGLAAGYKLLRQRPLTRWGAHRYAHGSWEVGAARREGRA